MNNKGVSPLIAVVLLIGLAVAVTTGGIIWGKNFFAERTMKTGITSDIQVDCLTNIEFTIGSIKYSYSQTKLGLQPILSVLVENRGDRKISGLVLKITGGQGESTIQIDEDILGKKVKTIVTPYDRETIGQPIEIKVIPLIQAGKDIFIPCQNLETIILPESKE